MEAGVSMLGSTRLSNNPYPDPNQPNSSRLQYFFKIDSNIVLHLRIGLPKGLFPVGLPDTILKKVLASSILAT